jgi:hypothetical protein
MTGGIVPRYESDGPGTESQWSRRGRSETHPASCTTGIG